MMSDTKKKPGQPPRKVVKVKDTNRIRSFMEVSGDLAMKSAEKPLNRIIEK